MLTESAGTTTCDFSLRRRAGLCASQVRTMRKHRDRSSKKEKLTDIRKSEGLTEIRTFFRLRRASISQGGLAHLTWEEAGKPAAKRGAAVRCVPRRARSLHAVPYRHADRGWAADRSKRRRRHRRECGRFDKFLVRSPVRLGLRLSLTLTLTLTLTAHRSPLTTPARYSTARPCRVRRVSWPRTTERDH